MDSSEYDSDEEFTLWQYRDFLPKYHVFLNQREVWRRRIPEFQALPMGGGDGMNQDEDEPGPGLGQAGGLACIHIANIEGERPWEGQP